jgi:hypothetical protein
MPRTSLAQIVVMPLKMSCLPIDHRAELADRLDELVEQFGLAAVRRALAMVEAANV